jgi:hypothetical protein
MTADLDLIHFTELPQTVASILRTGFVYVAYPTEVAFLLPSNIQIDGREPEQFGMISFRESKRGDYSDRHCKRFGCFGICVSREWARNAGAMPVQYISRWGFRAIAFRAKLRKAAAVIEDEIQRYPDDSFRTMAFHNSAAARMIGAVEYANIVDEFRFYAPARDAWQAEWRISNPLPNYSIPFEARTAVERVVSKNGWPQVTDQKSIFPKDVLYFVCPQKQDTHLREFLPHEFRECRILADIPGNWVSL